MKKLIWVVVFRSKYEVTYRARVVGGYLYRHNATMIFRTNLDGSESPVQCTESMVFVPSVKRSS